MSLQVVSVFEEKLVIYFSYCEETTVSCFWSMAYYSHFSCHSNKIWRQAKFLCLLLTAAKFQTNWEKTPQIMHFHFFMSCRITSVTSYLSEHEAKSLQNGDVYLAQIPDFEWNIFEWEPLGALRSVMAHLFALFRPCHLILNFFSTGVSL